MFTRVFEEELMTRFLQSFERYSDFSLSHLGATKLDIHEQNQVMAVK